MKVLDRDSFFVFYGTMFFFSLPVTTAGDMNRFIEYYGCGVN